MLHNSMAPFGRSDRAVNNVGASNTATAAVLQNAIPMGCMSGTSRTRMAAVLIAPIDAIKTNNIREFAMARLTPDLRYSGSSG